MGLAKKCDRCRNLYEPEDMDIRGAIVNGLSLINRDEQNTKAIKRRYFDLCPECLISLSNWLKNEPTTFNEIRQAASLKPVNGSDNVL